MCQSLKDLSLDFQYAVKKPGQLDHECKVVSNFAPIKIAKNNIVYQYNIEIALKDKVNQQSDKNVPQRNRMNRQKKIVEGSTFKIFKEFFDANKKDLFTNPDGSTMPEPIFDGRKIFLTKRPIKLENGTRGTYEVKVKVPEKKFGQTLTVTITTPPDSHEINLSKLSGSIEEIRKAEVELQAIDLIISYGAKHFNLTLNSKMFVKSDDLINKSPSEREQIRFHLGELKEASFGHHQSAKLTENGVQLNVDRTATVFYKGGKLIRLLEEYLTEKRNGGGLNGGRGNFNQRGRGRGGSDQRGRGRGGSDQRGRGRGGRGDFNQRGGGFSADGDQSDKVVINSNFRFTRLEINALNDELKGLAFILDHISYHPKNIITKISDTTSGQQTFTEKVGEIETQWTVEEYYKKKYQIYFEKYNIEINGNLPCVQVGLLQGARFFPMEVVSIVPDQYYTKKLNSQLQPQMTRRCGEQPPTIRFKENESQIQNLIDSSKRCDTDFLKTYGISLSNKFDKIDARYLTMPKLLGPKNQEKDIVEGQWRKTNYFIPANISADFDWCVVNVTSLNKRSLRAPDAYRVKELVENLTKAAKLNGLSLHIKDSQIYDVKYDSSLKYDIKASFEDFCGNIKNLKFILFIIPEDDELYSYIKYYSELTFGIVTQCVSQKKANKFSDQSYCNNMMLKINSKLGGTNWQLHPDSRIGHLKKKTMIMGLDVTHPAKHDRLGNSVASVVGTYDKTYVNYYSKCVVQPKPRMEIVRLDEITKELLDNFFLKNKSYPDNILVYRDGVSDGQFDEVVRVEIGLMKKAFAEINLKGEKYNPSITFIVVQKRHHTRFLPVNDKDKMNANPQRPGQKPNHNPKVGLVVDSKIVSNYYFDFYLSSHRGELGTTRPSRYIVLYNDSNFTGDEIHKTTYYLSHLFPRCTKVVSVPPPVLYAHLAAKRARSYLFTMDNKRGQVFGETELTQKEALDVSKKIEVKANLQNTLYFV